MANNNPTTPPGSAVRGMIQSAAANGRARRSSPCPWPATSRPTATARSTKRKIAPSPRWKQVVAKKSTIYPGSSLVDRRPTRPTATSSPTSSSTGSRTTRPRPARSSTASTTSRACGARRCPPVGNRATNPGPGRTRRTQRSRPVGGRTHPLIHPYAPTFAEMRDKTIAHAGAIKDVNPNALVFGGVGYGWNEFTIDAGRAGRQSPVPSHPGGDQSGEMHYNE